MAEGGKHVDSVLGQHDEVFEHTCTRCGTRGSNVDASCYCRSCHRYFCNTDRDVQGEFARDHDKLPTPDIDPREIQRSVKMDMDECPLHEGHDITIFCGQHETLCCTVCVSLNHSSCEKKNFVPELAKDIAINKKEMQFVQSNIHILQGRLKNVRTTKEQMQIRLKDSRTNNNKQLADFRFKVDDIFNNLLKITNDNMDQFYQSRYSELDNQLEICDTLIEEFAVLQTKLADDSIVDTKRFVNMKDGKEKVLECIDVLNNLSQPMHYDIVFSTDKSVLDRMEEIEELGQFDPTPAPGKSTEITGVKNARKFTVRAKEDKTTCYIQGICMLADGTIIMSDYYNRNIKRIDESYVTREVCSMPGRPDGVCCTGKRSVAVALGSKKKVQMVSVTDKMRTTEELMFKHDCNGIAYAKHTIYITGVHFLIPTLYEYTLGQGSGKTTCNLVRTFTASLPKSIAVSGNGYLVYLVNNHDKMTILNRDGITVQSTEHPNLKSHEKPSICVDMRGNVIVAAPDVGIIQFKDSGTEQNGTLLKDEVKRPGVVFVDHVRSKLIVVKRKKLFGCSDTVKMWDIVY